MPKPKKDRFVLQPPSVVYYKPQGIPLFQLEQVILGVDEYEAIRLVDNEGLQQQEAAERMKISRATCARILERAHHKIAEALTDGKAIRIEGGSFVLGRNRYRCRQCNTLWEIPMREDSKGPQKLACPHCKSDRVMNLGREVGLRGAFPDSGLGPGGGRRGWGRRGSGF